MAKEAQVELDVRVGARYRVSDEIAFYGGLERVEKAGCGVATRPFSHTKASSALSAGSSWCRMLSLAHFYRHTALSS